MRRIVVLHVLDDLETGGAERQVAAFVVRSDARGFRHEVCALSEGGRFASPLDAAGVPVHVLGIRPGMDLVRSAQRLRRLVTRIRPDLLHATLYRPGVVSRFVGRVSGIPVVTTLVSTTYEPEWYLDNPRLRPWKVWGIRTLDAMTARRWGTAFVAISETVKASAMRRLGLSSERIVVIPRGLAFDGPDEAGESDVAGIRQALGLTGARPILLNVARLVPAKGQQYLIRAMTDVVERYPTARLLIAGDGWLRPQLDTLIRSLGLADYVLLLGERVDVDVLLRAADIFVFPSLVEGLGNALLEAMAAARPCVTSDIPTLREVTGDGAVALLAHRRSPASLSRQILRLTTDPDLAGALGAAGREWVRRRYDIRTIVPALEQLYYSLAASPAVAAIRPARFRPRTAIRREPIHGRTGQADD